jgi:murein DD-endopeptidase MepM/ murein hydrolase activator NlpD
MVQFLFRAVLIILSIAWGLILFGAGQAGIYAWWFVMFFGLVGVLLLAAALVLLIVRLVKWRAGGRAPQAALIGLLALAVIAAWPAGWFMDLARIPYPASRERVQPAATIRLPIDQPARIAWGGDSVAVNYHVTNPFERWAYDLLGDPAALKVPDLPAYGIYGVEVLAPASGTVVGVRGDRADLPAGTELDSPDVHDMLGNYVFIRLDETNTYLVIAHLQQGSILVQPNQRVSEGMPIARVGNSGSTSEPHIHIHHQRQDPSQTNMLFAEGLPLYFRYIDGPPMPLGGVGVVDGREVPIGQIVTPNKQ